MSNVLIQIVTLIRVEYAQMRYNFLLLILVLLLVCADCKALAVIEKECGINT